MGTLIGYARCSTDAQDLTVQRQQLLAMGVAEDRIYTDQGMTGRNRDRPGCQCSKSMARMLEVLVTWSPVAQEV